MALAPRAERPRGRPATTEGDPSDGRQEPTALDHFRDEGLITDVIRIVKTGKEASVHLCRANPSTTGEELVASRVYHPLDRRDFRDESIERDGEWIEERRVRVALEKRTRFGRRVQSAIWVGREWEMLGVLHGAGVSVPRPISLGRDAILMSFVGDEDDAVRSSARTDPPLTRRQICSARSSGRPG